MAHALAPDLGASYLDPAALADNALKSHPFILTAIAFPILDRPEYLFAEEAVLFRLERTIVYGLRFLDLAIGPGANLLG